MRLETGERRLTEKWALRIAAAFGVSPYEIWGDSDMIVSAEERELIERMRQLPPAAKTAILETVKNLAPSNGSGEEAEPDGSGDGA